MTGTHPNDETLIRAAAARLDAALERHDVETVVACFAPDCVIEVLGVTLHGHAGVRRWLDWVFERVERIHFEPRLTAVAGDTFVEEFVVHADPGRGRRLESRWAELLTYRDGLCTSLRLYFDPLEMAPAIGPLGRLAGPIVTRLARGGLGG